MLIFYLLSFSFFFSVGRHGGGCGGSGGGGDHPRVACPVTKISSTRFHLLEKCWPAIFLSKVVVVPGTDWHAEVPVETHAMKRGPFNLTYL
jgi:hypothetical protein